MPGDLGNYLNAAALVGIAVASFYASRARSTLSALREAADAWKSERDAEKARSERLEGEMRAKEIENARLRAATDIRTTNLKLDALLAAFTGHEDRASERHQSFMHALEAIAQRISPG